MAIDDYTRSLVGLLRGAGTALGDLATPTIRLGITGFSRSGKTVLITALVRNLVEGGRLPFFAPVAGKRFLRAYLEPQPDHDVPRFAYEEHLAALAGDPPEWPQSTRRISQLRVTIEYLPSGALRRQLGVSRLHLDIVDYPGEWLTDLALMEQSFSAWSAAVLAAAKMPRRIGHAGELLSFIAALAPDAAADEQVAIAGAAVFTRYLQAVRALAGNFGTADPTLGPGRFLLPGELEGSPLLTFFPFPLAAGPSQPAPRSGLAGLLAERFEAYKSKVVKPFFREHFARLDRQVVLVDALAALDQGPGAIADLEASLAVVLEAFRPGPRGWLSVLLPRRIDRVLLAATKADHLHPTSHDRLQAILAELTRRASARSESRGAEVKALAIAALRATREAEVKRDGESLPCIVGTPLAGERLGSRIFDGRTSAAIFPGDLPDDVAAVIAGHAARAADPDVRFVRFRPARIPPESPAGEKAPWPHVRLDRALDFLIGDRLA